MSWSSLEPSRRDLQFNVTVYEKKMNIQRRFGPFSIIACVWLLAADWRFVSRRLAPQRPAQSSVERRARSFSVMVIVVEARLRMDRIEQVCYYKYKAMLRQEMNNDWFTIDHDIWVSFIS